MAAVIKKMNVSQVGAECGKLCDFVWWKTVTPTDEQAKLDRDADVNVGGKNRVIPPFLMGSACRTTRPFSVS